MRPLSSVRPRPCVRISPVRPGFCVRTSPVRARFGVSPSSVRPRPCMRPSPVRARPCMRSGTSVRSRLGMRLLFGMRCRPFMRFRFAMRRRCRKSGTGKQGRHQNSDDLFHERTPSFCLCYQNIFFRTNQNKPLLANNATFFDTLTRQM